MRKVRDFDAELKALGERARVLKARKVEQLGALVAATGADTLDRDMLAGVLLAAVGSRDASAKEAWARQGAAFFQRRARAAGIGAGSDRAGADDHRDGATPC